MIVVDTNVVVSLYIATPESGSAERALRRDPEWAAPLLWRSELRNVLASLMHGERLGHPEAVQIAHAAEALIAGREFAMPSDEVLDLAYRSGCTAYDCEFVALARSAGIPLVTLDQEVLQSFPEIAVPPGQFAD